MKIWWVTSTVLSGVVLALFLASMDSCSHSYVIDAQGRLLQPAGASEGDPSVKANPSVQTWETRLPEFAGLAAQVRPGDRLVQTTTSAGAPVLTLSMSTLEVVRNGERVIRATRGGIAFWGTIAGISSLPLVTWTLVAIGLSIARSGLPRRGAG